jgi:hypothetical protein
MKVIYAFEVSNLPSNTVGAEILVVEIMPSYLFNAVFHVLIDGERLIVSNPKAVGSV